MRKSVALGMAVLFACAVASFAVATEKRSSKPASRHATGEIVSVDATAKTLTVKEKDKDMTFTIADSAKVMIHGKAGSLDQLKAGDHVSVRFTEKDGASIAQNVSVVKAPAQKKG
jgi:Cu/Ag efflux protein CusF